MELVALALSFLSIGVGVIAIVLSIWFFSEAKGQTERAETALSGIQEAVTFIRARQGSLTPSEFVELFAGFPTQLMPSATVGREPEVLMSDLIEEAMARAGISTNQDIELRATEALAWFNRVEHDYRSNPLRYKVLRTVRAVGGIREPLRVRHVVAVLIDDGSSDQIFASITELIEMGEIDCEQGELTEGSVLRLRS